jgi:hypothetical protein
LQTVRASRPLAVLFLGGSFLAGCGGDPQVDFRQENTDGFMAACTTTPSDPLIDTEICQCVIDTAQVRLRFTTFAEFDAAMKAPVADGDLPAPLPPEIVDIIADCVIEVGNL